MLLKKIEQFSGMLTHDFDAKINLKSKIQKVQRETTP